MWLLRQRESQDRGRDDSGLVQIGSAPLEQQEHQEHQNCSGADGYCRRPASTCRPYTTEKVRPTTAGPLGCSHIFVGARWWSARRPGGRVSPGGRDRS